MVDFKPALNILEPLQYLGQSEASRYAIWTDGEGCIYIQKRYDDREGRTPSGKCVFRLTLTAIALQEHIRGNQSKVRSGDISAFVERGVLYQAYRAAAETERAGFPYKESCREKMRQSNLEQW